MDAATAAAVAALVVSVLAMTIAIAQVLQQYLNTGQLIRMCDGVVYGKMPGRGRRVWEYSQFRFRVVYSVPQISLRPELWKESLTKYVAYERGLLPLPDLHHDVSVPAAHSSFLQSSTAKGTGSAHSAAAGEACWVSFCRIAQNSCTGDMFYELHHCDADRCPSDLPVVPMQVSMRDIVIIALMAGMRCTDASFERKSISMDGEAGAITSSWHPMLGSIIHFSPRNSHRPVGIRLRSGKIDPAWMARTWGVVTVAGRRYDARDRKTFEAYEGHSWVASSRGRSMVKASNSKSFRSLSPVRSFRLRSISPTQTLRRRKLSSRKRGNSSSNGGQHSSVPDISNPNGEEGLRRALKVPERSAKGEREIVSRLSPDNCVVDPSVNARPRAKSSAVQSRGWKQQLRALFEKNRGNSHRNGATPLPDTYTTDVEGHCAIGTCRVARDSPEINQNNVQNPNIVAEVPHSTGSNRGWNSSAYRTLGRLDGRPLQLYIEEKQKAENVRSQGQKKLLTWRPVPEDRSPSEDGDEGWHTSVYQLRRERSHSLIDKWRAALNTRLQMRQERDIQTEWEIETYYSTSRQSSVASSDLRRRRLSPTEVRSISRESHASRRSSRRGSITDHGDRRQQDIPANFAHKGRLKHALPDDHSVAYGADPILGGLGTETTHEHHYPTKNPDSSQRKKVHYNPATTEPDSSPSISTADEQGNLEVSQALAGAIGLAGSETTPAVEPRRGILRQPRPQFPEDPNPVREGVAPHRDPRALGVPPEARWTKISRGLVSPEVLEQARERFEEREDYVIVLRVLTREEIQILADRTQAIRAQPLWGPDQRQEAMLAPVAQTTPDGLTINGALSARKRHSNSLDDSRPLESESEAANAADPSVKSAESSTTWSGQSVYGSGESSKISYSPDTMSEPEEHDPGRQELQGLSDAVASANGSNNPKATNHRKRSPSPRQVLAEQLKERLRSNTGSMRRRASARSDSSSSSLSSSSDGSESDDLATLGRRNIAYFSNNNPTLDIPKSDRSMEHDVTRRKDSLENGAIKWLWVSQADVLPGYFANPWHSHFSSDTCLGAIVTMLEILEYYTDSSTLMYVDALPWCEQWLYQGRSTHPSYAINAMGGIIVPTEYHPVMFENYNAPMPAIQLLRSYHHQIDPSSYQSANDMVIERLAELMALDSWLSFCGRQPEIYDGRNNLLQSLPLLIQKLMSDFDYEFSSLDQTSVDGGHQIVKELAGLIAHTLDKEMLSEEEQLFTVVAMLRAAKMAMCLLNGPDTVNLREIFLRDIQVYLV